MFDQFPKQRPPLPKEIQAIYATYYKQNREGGTVATSLSKRMEAWLHKQVAKDLVGVQESKTTLEIGAGTLNQLSYEPILGPYDIVEPFTKFYEGSELLQRIRTIYADIRDIPQDHRYDRITAIATFEHLCDLPEIVARCGLLLNPGGELRVSIPSEGTFLWRFAQTLTTRLEFWIKYGLDFRDFINYEHVNSAQEVEEVLVYFFRNVTSKVFGFSKSLSFYQFYACTQPDIEHCKKFAMSM